MSGVGVVGRLRDDEGRRWVGCVGACRVLLWIGNGVLEVQVGEEVESAGFMRKRLYVEKHSR